MNKDKGGSAGAAQCSKGRRHTCGKTVPERSGDRVDFCGGSWCSASASRWRIRSSGASGAGLVSRRNSKAAPHLVRTR